VENLTISDKQRHAIGLLENPSAVEIFMGGSGGGPQPLDAIVKTPFGEKRIGDINIGDVVCGADGKGTRVIDIPYEGEAPVYEITTLDGSVTRAAENHIWRFKIGGRPRSDRLGTTKDMMHLLEQGHSVLLPLTEEVQITRSFPKNHKIPSYLMGALLGDGCFRGRSITFSSADTHIIDRLGEEVSGEIIHMGRCDYRLRSCSYEKQCLQSDGLWGLYSHEKFIPEHYKMSTIEERWKLLQGLMDTDGTIDTRGHLSFTSTSERLAKDVQWLVRSLGGNATLSCHDSYHVNNGAKKQGLPAYTLYLQHKEKSKFFSLPRKLSRVKPYNNGAGIPTKKIVKITPIDTMPVRCISVSNLDGLYLTNDFIVTHNSKTFTMAIMVLLTIRQYPGCRLFVGRKTLKSLRQSFIQTLLGQVHKMFNLVEDQDFNYSAQLGEIKYNNGSTVIFGELMKNPSDPDFSRFGSLELDMAFIEEAGEVTLEAKNAIRSRVGRGIMAKEHSLPGKLVLSGNPSQNFLRTEYYDPYMELGGGEYQSWIIGETVIRPDKKKVPKKVPMKRCFLRMSVYQNPFIPQSYIDTLKTLPRRERKRLLDGDWDYADDDSSLFKSGLIDKAITYELPQPSENFNKVIGVDVSDAGRDRTVFSLIDNGVLVTQKCSNVQMNWDRKSEEPLSYLIANELIEFAQRNGFQQVNAKNIAVESNGVGVGVRDALRVRGWTLTEYVNTGQSRSDNYYNLMLNMDSGTIKLYKDVSTLGELRKELGAHTYEMENQEPKVIKKSKLKETLGRSPDYSDSFMIASWMWDRKVNPQRDPKRNSKRISW
jgi:hypothetical protein